jgi:CheY-like chemotaxis protein
VNKSLFSDISTCAFFKRRQVDQVNAKTPFAILVVEDNDDDAFLLMRAFQKSGIVNPILRVKDGLEAIAYLEGSGDYGDREKYPFPSLLFVDLKMPRLSGFELLAWVREHPEFRRIPTIIMSASHQDSDVNRAYELGASTYFVKPSSMDELTRLVRSIHAYWAQGTKPNRQIRQAVRA